MRGFDRPQSTMLTLVNPEKRGPANHSIRLIRRWRSWPSFGLSASGGAATLAARRDFTGGLVTLIDYSARHNP